MENMLTFYGGLDTVGGVQVLFQKGETGMLFDAGIPHSGLITAPYIHLNEPIKPIEGREIRQFLLSKMAPPIVDLYDRELLGEVSEVDLRKIWQKDDLPRPEKLVVFITHIHQDHIALLPYLRDDVTIFMHQDAYAQYQALVSAGYYKDTKACVKTFVDEQVLDVEDFQVKALEVDHMTPGTSGFIIHSGEKRIAYTADWRMNGLYANRMEKFVKQCQVEKVDVLLTETTKVKDTPVDPDFFRPEAVLLKEYAQLLEGAKGLVYLLALPMNLERIANMIRLTKQAGKTLVMEEKIARYWWNSVQHGVGEWRNHPAVDEEGVVRILESDSDDLPFGEVRVEEIGKNKQDFVLQLNYTSLAYLMELERLGDAAEKSIFIHANTPVHQDTLQKWLAEFSIEYYNISNSGHASPEDISKLIQRISPKVVIPVHGKKPHLLDSRGVPIYFPTYGEEVSVEDVLKRSTNGVLKQ